MNTSTLREVQCVQTAVTIARSAMTWREYIWRLEAELTYMEGSLARGL